MSANLIIVRVVSLLVGGFFNLLFVVFDISVDVKMARLRRIFTTSLFVLIHNPIVDYEVDYKENQYLIT